MTIKNQDNKNKIMRDHTDCLNNIDSDKARTETSFSTMRRLLISAQANPEFSTAEIGEIKADYASKKTEFSTIISAVPNITAAP